MFVFCLAVAAPATASQISLAWNDNSTNETGFKIERALPNQAFAQIAVVGANVTAYTDANVTASTTYGYRVRASNGSGDSPYTNELWVTAPAEGNTAPTISSIASQSISSGSATGPLSFTVNDAETSATNLLVTGSSSNTALVPQSAIVFGGSGSSRTVSVTPIAGQTGTTTITLTVSDGAQTTNTSFVLTVNSTSGTPSSRTFSNDSPVRIPDNASDASPFPSAIQVSGMSGLISNVTVQLRGFSQVWTNDMDVLLVSPTGQKLLLMSDVGTGVTNNVTFTFSDAATASLPESGGLSGGSYKPTNYTAAPDTFNVPAPAGPYATTFSTFHGQNPNGTWSLFVTDPGSGQGRRFEGGWSITITTSASESGAAPTISDIGDLTIAANTSTAPLSFTISDPDTAASSLSLTASSSNPTLVQNSSIVFGGSGSSRTVKMTPVSGQSGKATITVVVSDGARAATDSFVLTVTPVEATNTAPTISSIPSQMLASGTNSGEIWFVVGDAETPAGNLTLSANSSNTTLVPVQNIAFSGTGKDRAVKVTPAAGRTGSSTITVTVSDGALSASVSFTVTVVTGNLAPSISDIADATIAVGTATSPLSFSVADAETSASNLTLSGKSSNTSLVPDAGIQFGGSGSNRTVTITPASGQTGTAVITVTVSDGSLSAEDTFTVTVLPASGPESQIYTFATSTPIVIPDYASDATPYPSQIKVSGTSGVISTVRVQLRNFSQVWTNDMDVLLVSPSGQKLLLMSDVATGVTNNITLTFSDNAAASLPESGSLYTGTYKPTNYDAAPDTFTATLPTGPFAASLAAFNGYPANGTWSLYCADSGSGMGRRFDGGWTLTVTTSGTTGSTPAGPSIGDIADVSLAAGTSSEPLSFVVSDPDTPATSLVLSGSSSNPALVPNSAIVFGGSGSNRTVSVTPIAGQTGATTITVSVSDGQSTASETFVVYVTTLSTQPVTKTFSNSNPIVIPDSSSMANPYPSQILVDGMNGTIVVVRVTLHGFGQSWTNDMDVLLVSPTGQKLLLMSDVGTGVTNNVTLTFADDAASYLPESGGLTSGTYKPTNYSETPDNMPAPAPVGPFADSLAIFKGQPANGSWALYVSDAGTGFRRRFESGWSLSITTAGP